MMKTGLLFVVYFEIGLVVLAFLLGLFGLDAFFTYEQAKVVYFGLQYLIPVIFLYGIWRQRRTASHSH